MLRKKEGEECREAEIARIDKEITNQRRRIRERGESEFGDGSPKEARRVEVSDGISDEILYPLFFIPRDRLFGYYGYYGYLQIIKPEIKYIGMDKSSQKKAEGRKREVGWTLFYVCSILFQSYEQKNRKT
ncbi:hypothetical protein EAG_09266 [Camponotus floridanus]|uniref:Uncharacterized protein n=1 Tax=Camponotus floridanus TaxID=104421 RepID=E2B0A1_CAMFO|nr:hypothetical protein EAG_09266 [Camponotus floridanus]